MERKMDMGIRYHTWLARAMPTGAISDICVEPFAKLVLPEVVAGRISFLVLHDIFLEDPL